MYLYFYFLHKKYTDENTYYFFEQSLAQEVHFCKFLRRPDINARLRMSIAYQALYLHEYGLISRLSEEHGVSRTFIYTLRRQLEIWTVLMFGVLDEPLFERCEHTENQRLIGISQILALRLEGHCSISAIHLLLKRGGYVNSSVGYISELLNEIGGKLSAQLDLPEGHEPLQVVFASDEIFSKGSPILVSMDPLSSVILRMELVDRRTAEKWENHWQSLLDEGITPLLVVNDEGVAMAKAHKGVLPDVARQSDTFHAIAHRLGDYCRILLGKAFTAIEEEYERQRVYENRKTFEAALAKEQQYDEAIQNSQKAIENYEQFCFLYQYMIEALSFFDAHGKPNTPQKAKAAIQDAVNAIRQLGCCHKKMQKQLDTIEKLLPNLLSYLSAVEQIVQTWMPILDTPQKRKAFQQLCVAYEYIKNSRKHKHNKTKRYYLHRAKQLQENAQKQRCLHALDINLQDWIAKLYGQLERVVQSSAMVETINSILRTYLNGAKNQLNQNQLNLIMFYLNHRKYLRGKRKGSSPIELLYGQKQEHDWLEALLRKVALK